MGERRGAAAGDAERASSPTALLSHSGYATVNESTKYAKSLRYFTREALPRLDHYRNIMSLHNGAATRPTLDELHHPTVQDKVSILHRRWNRSGGRFRSIAPLLWPIDGVDLHRNAQNDRWPSKWKSFPETQIQRDSCVSFQGFDRTPNSK